MSRLFDMTKLKSLLSEFLGSDTAGIGGIDGLSEPDRMCLFDLLLSLMDHKELLSRWPEHHKYADSREKHREAIVFCENRIREIIGNK